MAELCLRKLQFQFYTALSLQLTQDICSDCSRLISHELTDNGFEENTCSSTHQVPRGRNSEMPKGIIALLRCKCEGNKYFHRLLLWLHHIQSIYLCEEATQQPSARARPAEGWDKWKPLTLHPSSANGTQQRSPLFH